MNHCHHVGAFYKQLFARCLINGFDETAEHFDLNARVYFEMANDNVNFEAYCRPSDDFPIDESILKILEDCDKPEYIDEHGMALKCCDVPSLPCSCKLDDDFVTHSPVGD